jgi:ribosomal protein S18 acetylase RimI-like enzyme
MRTRLEDPEVSLLVADEDGELVGFIACGPSRDPSPAAGAGEVQSLYVAPASWRRGAGRALMAAGLAALAERGYAHANVWSFAANERANAFYEAQGFERDGATRREEVWAHVDEVRYRRPLP